VELAEESSMSRPCCASLLVALLSAGACAEPPFPADRLPPERPWVTLFPADTAGDVLRAPADTSPSDAPAPPDLPAPPDTLPTDGPPRPDTPPDTSECPVAKIAVEEGDEVIPQTVLHLDGTGSWSSDGEITDYKWSVTQPPGSLSLFLPHDHAADPKLEANVAGTYIFELMVWDDTGAAACAPALYEVSVIPEDGIHVELLWHTPGDPDETDQGWGQGADLDLHFLNHAAEAWFDPVYDCHHYNKTPQWGSPNPLAEDDPRLDRDDIDGAGPENINLHNPQPMTYRVGVHSWSEHGYGNSVAEVRVYFWSVLAFQWGGVDMGDHFMWYVCDIDFDAGEVHAVEDQFGGPSVTWIDPPPPP